MKNDMMAIHKGRRHSKYIGQFGELLVCNWLSRSGFEVMLVDHVAIDIAAYRKDKGGIGISVKSRTRSRPGSETESVNLFSRTSDDEPALMRAVCQEFGLEPGIAVYVESANAAEQIGRAHV